MSGEQKIPRPATLLASSHTRPAEPFLPADDIEDVPPEEVHELTEPTLASVHRSVVALTKQQSELVETVGEHIKTDERRSGLIHEELALIRATLLGDHAPRLTQVEQKTLPQRVGSGAVAGVKLSVYVTAAVAVLNALAKQWPWLADIARALGSITL